MKTPEQVIEFLKEHLNAILENDIDKYHTTTHEDLTLYEWWVTPHRIDGLPFHDFMMTENARIGQVFGAEKDTSAAEAGTRFDLSNLKIQQFENTIIASYTILVSSGTEDGVKVASHNETRVIVNFDGQWKVVHVHKSPTWQAPHMPPTS